MTVPATFATLDHDLTERLERRGQCLTLMVRCVLDLADIDTSIDELLDQRRALTGLNEAAAASMNPGRAPGL